MLFEYVLSVPAATLATSPVVSDVPLAAGTIVKVGVQFPAGCSNLVRVSIWRSVHQIWPVNLDGYIASDDHVVEWPEEYDLDDEPFSLVLRGWSPSATYDHDITFRFALLPLATMRAARETPNLLSRIAAAILGRR